MNWIDYSDVYRGRRQSLVLSLLCLACLLTTVCIINHSGKTSAHTFALEKNPRLGVSWLGQAWKAKNGMECVRNCLRKYDNCKSVLYNPDTDLCKPGSQFNKTAPLPNPAEGNFYHSFLYCDVTAGFRVLSYGNTTSCIGKFGPVMNYTEAETACQNRGGFLASVKTMDKLEVVRQISDFEMIWVGCDDIDQEGIFVWKEDGETFLKTSPPSTFAWGQPDAESTWDEDCVTIDPNDYALNYLNDVTCNNTFRYACEKFYS